jgi:hypothetical protein
MGNGVGAGGKVAVDPCVAVDVESQDTRRKTIVKTRRRFPE